MPTTFDSLQEGNSRLFPDRNATPQIADSWALSLDPTKEDDYVLRTAATAIMKERFGITSYDGFVLSGDEARPLKPREFYDKVMKAFRAGSTDAWMEQYDIDFRNAEEGGDRAAMRKIAREHVKGETLGQKARGFVDKYDNFGAADTYGNDEERDKRIREELESIRGAISPEDWAAVEAYFGAGDDGESPSERKNAAAKRLQELNERLHQIERETISVPAYQETGYEDEIAQISEEQQTLEAELEEMEGGVEKARGDVDAIRRKYHDVLEDERRVGTFKAQMVDRNRWAYLAGLHGNITENAERVLTMAEKSAGNAGHPALLAEFEKLTTAEQRSISGALQMLHYGKDPTFKTFLGDMARSFADTLGMVTVGAARGAADIVRRTYMDADDYRDMVERRNLLEEANRERMVEWGYLGDTVLGVVSTIPYMAAAAVPYVGMADMMLSAKDQFQSEAARNGVDVASWDYQIGSAAFAIAYAFVERIQWNKAFGGISKIPRRQMYVDAFHSARATLALGGSIAGTMLTESGEEGLQRGLEEVAEHWGLKTDALADAVSGFVEDFVGSLGTMAIIGGLGAAKQGITYRHGAVAVDPAERLGAMSRADEMARHMEGEGGAGRELASWGREWGRMAADWLNAGNLGIGGRVSLMGWGFTAAQADAMNGSLSRIWTAIQKTDAASGERARLESEFVGGSKVLTDAEVAAKIQNGTYRGKVETDPETGDQTTTISVRGIPIKLTFRAARPSGGVNIDDAARHESIVNALNEQARARKEPANKTVEWFRGLLSSEGKTEEQVATDRATAEGLASGLVDYGNADYTAPDGSKIDGRVLAAIAGDVRLTDRALPQTAWHESMHGVLRVLSMLANGQKSEDGETYKVAPDAEAKGILDALKAENPENAPMSGREDVNEERLSDAFQRYMTGEVDVVEANGGFDRLGRFLANLFGYGTAGGPENKRARTAQDRLFNTAITGHIQAAMKQAEGEEPAPRKQAGPRTNPATATPPPTDETEAILRRVEAAGGDASAIATGFRNRDPLGKSQMAALHTASGGDLTTKMVWEAGYRWNPADQTWQHDPKLEHPVDERDLPQDVYMGADGDIHQAPAARHQIVAYHAGDVSIEDFDPDKASDQLGVFFSENPTGHYGEQHKYALAPRNLLVVHEGDEYREKLSPRDGETAADVRRRLLAEGYDAVKIVYQNPAGGETSDYVALDKSAIAADARHQVSADFAMDGTVVDALPAHLREDGRAIVAERANTPEWMADPDGTPTDLSERDWLRREAERRHEATAGRLTPTEADELAELEELRASLNDLGGIDYREDPDYERATKRLAELERKYGGGEQRYQISGQVGAEALGLRSSADAEAMERSGADRETIWRETGWWRGKDGMWRVEIPDFELVPDAVRLLLANGSAHLSDLVPPDSAILRAYQSLGKMRIDVVDGGGEYQGVNNGINIEISRGSISDLQNILPHEIQHTVQVIEGFSGGGNISSAKTRLDEMLEERYGERSRAAMAEANNILLQLDKIPRSRRGKYKTDEDRERAKQLRERYDALRDEADSLDREAEKIRRSHTSRSAYRALAGEAEARLVQKRLGMTPEERAARPPWMDFDVAKSEQIVRGMTMPAPSAETSVVSGADTQVELPDGTRHSIKSAKYDLYESSMLDDLVDHGIFTAPEAAEFKRRLEHLIDLIAPNAFFLDLNEKFGKDDRPYKPFKPNSDPLYKLSLDFSTLCKKRLFTQYVIEQLQLKLDRVLSAEEQLAIRDKLKEYAKEEKGLQVACHLCYVEAARLKAPKQINRFFADPVPVMINYFAQKNAEFEASVQAKQAAFKKKLGLSPDATKNEIKEKKGGKYVTELNRLSAQWRQAYKPSAEERAIIEKARRMPRSAFLTANNLAELSQSDPHIFAAYSDFIRMSTHSKGLETDVPYYYGDSAALSDKFIQTMNEQGTGMRHQSWSDFQMRHLLDTIVAVCDLSVRGAKMHAYTKVEQFARIFGRTGIMVNLSLIPNEDGNGFSPTEGLDYEVAKSLRDRFPDTCGTIAIGMSDEHVLRLIDDPTVDYVIPYHVSGLNKGLRKMAGIDNWSDFTSRQHEKKEEGRTKPADMADELWHKEPEQGEWILRNLKCGGAEAMRRSAQKYLDLCYERGLVPKFAGVPGLVKRTPKGWKLVNGNYWKLLIDHKMINQKTDRLIEQRPVRPDFDFDEIETLLKEEIAGYDPTQYDRALDYVMADLDELPARIRQLKKSGEVKRVVREARKVAKAERDARRHSVAPDPAWDDAAGQADAAAREADELARESVTWEGPAFSYQSFAEAFAARDAALKIKRPPEQYQRLLDSLGIADKVTVDDLMSAARQLKADVRGASDTIADLAGRAEQKKFVQTVRSLVEGANQMGVEVGGNARRAWEKYLSQMRRSAKGRDYADFFSDTRLDFARLLLSLSPDEFDERRKEGEKPAEPEEERRQPPDPEDEDAVRAFLDAEGVEGADLEALRERVRQRAERKMDEIRAMRERIRARLDEWRKSEEERRRRAEEREKAHPPKENDETEQDFDESGEDTEGGTKRLDEYENESAERLEDFKAFVEALRQDGLDISNAGEFAAAIRIYVEDWLARETGSSPDDVLKDPVNAARYRATVLDILRSLCSQLLDPADGKASIVAERMLAEIPGDATPTEIQGRTRAIVAFVQRNAIRQSAKQMIKDLRKTIKVLAIKGKKFDETEKDLGRKITGEREQYARYLYRILDWSDGRIAQEEQRLNDIISGRREAYEAARATDAGLEALARTDREIHRAMERLQALRLWGGLRRKMPGEIALGAQQIKSWLETERDEHEKRWAAWKEALDREAEALATAFSADRRDFSPDDAKFVEQLGDALTTNFRQRLERLAVGSGAEGRRAIDAVMRRIYEGSERLANIKAQQSRRFDALLARCVEGTGMSVADFLKSLDEKIPEELNRRLTTADQNTRMTWGQALQLLGQLEQTASYQRNIDANNRGAERTVGTDEDGNPIKEAQTPHRQLIVEALSDKPQMLRLLEELRTVYDENRAALSDEFQRVTGNPILSPDPLYLPARMYMGARDNLETTVRAWNPFGPAFSPRVSNTADFDLSVSILDIFKERQRETATALAFGVRGMELRSILARKEVQDAIAKAHGKFALRKMVAHLTDIVGDGYRETGNSEGFRRMVQMLGNITTYSALSWNVVTMLKQMTSIPSWTALMDGGYAEVFKYICEFDRAAAKELVESPGFVARYGATGFVDMIRSEMRNPQDGNLVSRLAKAGMTLVQIGDFVPGIVVGTGVYKARKLALMRQGLNEEAARQQAATETWGLIEENQQSSRLENTPEFLRRGGFLARQLSKFASSPMMQVAHEMHTLRMWIAEKKAAQNRGEDGGEEVARWRRRFVNQVICNHILMPAAFYAVATLFGMALGDEPPDDDELLGDVLMQMVAGPWSRIFLVGMVADQTGEWIARAAGSKPNVHDNAGLAAQQHLAKAMGQVGRIVGDVADLDWESVRDDFVKMVSQVNAPFRYAAKFTQNKLGYDPAKARRERKKQIKKERGE